MLREYKRPQPLVVDKPIRKTLPIKTESAPPRPTQDAPAVELTSDDIVNNHNNNNNNGRTNNLVLHEDLSSCTPSTRHLALTMSAPSATFERQNVHVSINTGVDNSENMKRTYSGDDGGQVSNKIHCGVSRASNVDLVQLFTHLPPGLQRLVCYYELELFQQCVAEPFYNQVWLNKRSWPTFDTDQPEASVRLIRYADITYTHLSAYTIAMDEWKRYWYNSDRQSDRGDKKDQQLHGCSHPLFLLQLPPPDQSLMDLSPYCWSRLFYNLCDWNQVPGFIRSKEFTAEVRWLKINAFPAHRPLDHIPFNDVALYQPKRFGNRDEDTRATYHVHYGPSYKWAYQHDCASLLEACALGSSSLTKLPTICITFYHELWNFMLGHTAQLKAGGLAIDERPLSVMARRAYPFALSELHLLDKERRRSPYLDLLLRCPYYSHQVFVIDGGVVFAFTMNSET